MPITVKNSRSRDLHGYSASLVSVGQMSAGWGFNKFHVKQKGALFRIFGFHNGVELNSGWLSYGKCHTPHDELG